MDDSYESDFEDDVEDEERAIDRDQCSGSGSEERVKELESQLAAVQEELCRTRVQLRRAKASPGAPRANSTTSTSNNSNSSYKLQRRQGAEQAVAVEIPFAEVALGERLSGGGFCTMHRATWHSAQVAVKRIFDPKITDKLMGEFHCEVKALSTLRHPNIVSLFGCCSRPPNLCIVMEMMDRGSLYHVLHESAIELSMAERAWLARQAACGILFMHQRQWLHRDVKSLNVLANACLEVKLCDLGLACRVEDVARLPHTQLYIGTPQYMAPEAFRQTSKPTFATDTWAFGALLWEIFTRQVPWDGLDAQQIRANVLEGKQLDTPASMPREIAALVKECMVPSPASRPPLQRVLMQLDVYHAKKKHNCG